MPPNDPPLTLAEHATRARQCLDTLLAQKPKPVGEDFSATTRQLSAWRDALIAERRAGTRGTDQQLRTVNAVLSVVIGGHFPLQHVPWEAIEKARKTIKEDVLF